MPERDPRQPAGFDPIATAKLLLRTVRSGALATLDKTAGHPLSTLTSVATDFDGTPLILISGLSNHTKNLQSDPRCSLLLAQVGKGDPLAHPRLSVNARAVVADREKAKPRFLARHPKAAIYADFGDFDFWRLEAETIHLNGGFARAYDGPAADILTSLDGADELLEIEASAISHMNSDHAEAAKLYAEKLLKQPPGNWKVTGIDPEGMDLMANEQTARLAFPKRITGGGELRRVLKELADQARG